MLTPRIMKLHRYIDHVWQMTPIDFQVTKSKVKFTVTKNTTRNTNPSKSAMTQLYAIWLSSVALPIQRRLEPSITL
ncbi:hypothetical protein DPMN_160210 [Dreissena polymorpha]|uniref:Uncharacterized protein n=1 Tax=Dreissena polymorpha TaxID=45954 RepID=A0A9D4EQS2_DREPO|nr:hypothetical protein DPMN_160210 [Dreissena polymorpha]